MKKKRIDPDKIHLDGLRILKSSFEVMADAVDEVKVAEIVKFGYKTESAFNYDENYHRLRLYLKVEGRDHTEEKLICTGEYVIEFHYLIENLSDFMTENKEVSGGYTISAELGATISGISYSTTRGIIFERTQATGFSGILLPVISPMKLLQDDTYSDDTGSEVDSGVSPKPLS